jgi:molybdopterin-containing oxidoreductase family membrane subunit
MTAVEISVAEPLPPSSLGAPTVPRWATTAAWTLTGICTALGLVGLVWRFVAGHGAANYGSYVPWGLWIAAYVALVGASAGAFAVAALIFTQRRREYYPMAILSMLVALGTFAAGIANVWLDLGHPFRAYKLMLDTEFGSVMGLMAWLYTAYAIILVVGLVATRHGNVPNFLERFAWVAFVFAIVFAGAEGALFGVVGARPLWESGITPVLFLVEAALFGLALVVATAATFGMLTRQMARRVGLGMLVLLGALLALEWAEFSTGLSASVPAKEDALQTILTGRFWWVFWILHLGLGVLLPGVLLLRGRSKVAWVGVAGALIAMMGIASKLNLVLPALAQEEIDGLQDAFHGPGLTTSYSPSAMEWLVWFGTLGLVGLIVLIGRQFTRRALDTAAQPDPEADDEMAASEVDPNMQEANSR